MSEELTEYVASNAATGDIVDQSLLDCRKNDGTWQLLVKWTGFTDLDHTWEPAVNLIEDVPAIVESFISSKSSDEKVQAFVRDLSPLSKKGEVWTVRSPRFGP